MDVLYRIYFMSVLLAALLGGVVAMALTYSFMEGFCTGALSMLVTMVLAIYLEGL